MKYFFLFLLAVSLLACNKSITPRADIKSEVTYIVGYTGGWGGGPAFKLENGQLLKSDEVRSLGEPGSIVNSTTYSLLNNPNALQALSQLFADFPEAAFQAVSPKFDCPEMAYDGVCPYLIVVDNNKEFRAWTASEEDPESPFTQYMERVATAIQQIEQ